MRAHLFAAVGVHALVSAEVRELRVGLAADVAAEWLDAAVDVLVLLQSARRREVLAALRARVRPITIHPRPTSIIIIIVFIIILLTQNSERHKGLKTLTCAQEENYSS